MFRGLSTRGFNLGSRLMSTMVSVPKMAIPSSFQSTPFSLYKYTPSLIQLQPKITFPINNIVAIEQEEDFVDNTMYTDSVLRKRRLKMKKHKLRKRRKAQRSLMQRLGKI